MSSCRAFSLHVCECLLVWVYPAPVLEKNGLEKNSFKLNESILGHIKTAFFFFVVFSLENTILHPFCVYFYCFWEQSGRLKVHQPHKWAELRQNEMIYDTRSEPRSAVTGGGGETYPPLLPDIVQTLMKKLQNRGSAARTNIHFCAGDFSSRSPSRTRRAHISLTGVRSLPRGRRVSWAVII